MIFINETEDLKNNLLRIIESLTTNIKTHHDNCNFTFSKYTKDYIKSNIAPFNEYFSMNIGLEKTLKNICSDIIIRSKKATDWENRDGIFKWIGTKIFDEDYLVKTIDFMIESTRKIQSFIDNSKELIEQYKHIIIIPITSTKDRVLDELEERKEEEEIQIKQIQAKNEFEIRQWKERKNIFENNKLRWADICKKYRILKDEIYENLNSFLNP